MKIKIKNLLLGLKSQMPLKKFIREFFITKNAWGLFNINSHINHTSKKEKVGYPTQKEALKASEAMSKKYNKILSPYKCIFCDNWHIGNDKK